MPPLAQGQRESPFRFFVHRFVWHNAAADDTNGGMASLQHPTSSSSITLYPRHGVGRASTSDLTVGDRLCSTRHCEIVWDGDRWTVLDLNSRNGTWIDGHRLEGRAREPLRIGQELAFGNPAMTFRVLDIEPPGPVFIAPDGAPVFAERGVLSAPPGDHPTVMVHRDGSGLWSIIRDDGSQAPAPRESQLLIGGQTWRLLCPAQLPSTARLEVACSVEQLALRFFVDDLDEVLYVEALLNGVAARMEPRAFHPTLLELARARVADTERGLDEAEQGWLHRAHFFERFGHDEGDLNTMIFRIRRQFAQLDIQNSSHIIERHPPSARLRLGISDVMIRAKQKI